MKCKDCEYFEREGYVEGKGDVGVCCFNEAMNVVNSETDCLLGCEYCKGGKKIGENHYGYIVIHDNTINVYTEHTKEYSIGSYIDNCPMCGKEL